MMTRSQAVFLSWLLGTVMTMTAACAYDDAAENGMAVNGDRKQVLAPIDAAELAVRESTPTEYAVQITSGLPSGCAEFERIDIARESRRIDLTVWNTMPTDESIPCTMIYGTAHHTVELGDHFESGENYEVHINDETILSFTAR